MKTTNHLLLSLLFLCSAPILLIAQSEETPAAEETKLPFEISGFVDVYYMAAFNDMAFPTSFTEEFNSFSLGMANVAISKNSGKVGFLADIALGPRAEVANGFSGTSLSAIKQLYVTYAPNDAISFTLGNFGTHVGYEIIDAPGNLNYSTSYMFSNGPFYHTGLKMDVALSDNFGFMVGLFDDTDSKMDFVPGKHIGLQLSYSDDATGIYLNYIAGRDQEETDFDPEAKSSQFDLTATFQATEKFGLGLNATTKNVKIMGVGDYSWSGAALYANLAITEGFTLAARGEYISDQDGLIMGATDGSILGLTLSGNIHLGDLTIIPEFRTDSGPEMDDIAGFILAAVYSF
jgi:hypothetical protein